MPYSARQTLPEPEAASDILRPYFATASTLGRLVERQHLQDLLRQGASQVYSLPIDTAGSAGVLFIESKPWEAGFFGCPAVFLTLAIGSGEYARRNSSASALLDAYMGSKAPGGRVYATARTSADDLPAMQALEARGFQILVPTITLERSMEVGTKGGGEKSTNFLVEIACESDVQRLREIARHAFQFGRYSVEPRLPDNIAGEMLATWAANCVNGQQADTTLVVRQGGKAIGFLGVKRQNSDGLNLAIIVLIAVDEKARGLGVGRALVQAACAWARERGSSHMIVRTEAPNTAAMRLYERQGFTTASSGIYFARWW
jgi:dTDP-4-amino-4,6-dideoxy-D-galactose acyltransferase